MTNSQENAFSSKYYLAHKAKLREKYGMSSLEIEGLKIPEEPKTLADAANEREALETKDSTLKVSTATWNNQPMHIWYSIRY
jgi:hypothetical protein